MTINRNYPMIPTSKDAPGENLWRVLLWLVRFMAWSKLSRHQRGYGAQWVKTRAAVLARDMNLCQPCLAMDRTTPAFEVDHIIPKSVKVDDSPENLQAICHDCHKAKSRREATNGRGGRLRPTIGADGWPVKQP